MFGMVIFSTTSAIWKDSLYFPVTHYIDILGQNRHKQSNSEMEKFYVFAHKNHKHADRIDFEL